VSFANGEITDHAADYMSASVDASGSSYSEKISTTISVQATWLPIGSSNRRTAPDVRRGELVVLYQFADTDQFWWTTLKDDANLRKLETVIYAFSGTRDENATANADNCYFLEISTHNKIVHFHTSNADGEPYKYDIQINTGKGFIQIQDDQGNYIKFDTAAHQISIVNQDSSMMEVNKTNINMVCTDDFNIQCNNLNAKVGSNIVANVGSSTTLNSPDIKTTGKVAQMGDVNITGATDILGNLGLTGGFAAAPGPSGTGVTISGDVNSTGAITNNGVNIGSQHKHGGVMPGPGSSDVPH
jgi:hypothetical protein